jgi:surface antigen
MIFVQRLSMMAMALVLLGACSNPQDAPKQTLGSLLGAGAGALAGSQIGSGRGQLVAVAIGALGGAMFGGEVGKSLDKADRAYAGEAAQNALETNRVGQPTTWRNPDSGHSGTVVPTATYESAGTYCREYSSNVQIDGKTESAHGRACREPDGTWRIVQ